MSDVDLYLLNKSDDFEWFCPRIRSKVYFSFNTYAYSRNHSLTKYTPFKRMHMRNRKFYPCPLSALFLSRNYYWYFVLLLTSRGYLFTPTQARPVLLPCGQTNQCKTNSTNKFELSTVRKKNVCAFCEFVHTMLMMKFAPRALYTFPNGHEKN